jgi:hypothetical protein
MDGGSYTDCGTGRGQCRELMHGIVIRSLRVIVDFLLVLPVHVLPPDQDQRQHASRSVHIRYLCRGLLSTHNEVLNKWR